MARLFPRAAIGHNARMRGKFRYRRLIRLAVILIAGMCALYAYMTRAGALAGRLRDKLAEVNVGVVELGEISFSLIHGLQIRDLELAGLDAPAVALQPAGAEIPLRIRIPYAHVRINPWLLLFGRFQPREVILDQPNVALIRPRRSTGMHAGLGELGSASSWTAPPVWLPRLSIRHARVDVSQMIDERPVLRRRLVLNGEGRLLPTTPGAPREYRLSVEQAGGPASPLGGQRDLATVRWSGRQLAVESDWLDLELEQGLLPVEWHELCGALRLKGRFAVLEAVLEARGLVRARLEFADLGGVIPVEEAVADPARECFLRLHDAAAELMYARNDIGAAADEALLRGGLQIRFNGGINDGTASAFLDCERVTLRPAARAGEADQRIAGVLEMDAIQGEISVRDFTIPNVKDNPRFVDSPHMPEALRDWIHKYDARGRVNLHVKFSDDGAFRAPTYAGRLEALDGSCRYQDFPYLITDARGAVSFSNDGIFFEGLNGRHGASGIRLDGRLVDSESWTGFELNFRGQNVVSDTDLYAALPARYQTLWRRAAPVGVWDVAVKLQREHGSAESGSAPTQIRVDARLLAGSLRLQRDVLLENATGMVHIDAGRVELDDLFGYVNGSLTCVNGFVRAGDADEPPDYDIRVEVADSPLEKTSVVQDGNGEVIGRLGFEGVGDIRAQLNAGRETRSHYAVQVKDGTLRGFDAELPWSNARGWIVQHGEGQEIRALSAERAGGELRLSGSVPAQFSLDAPVQLELAATDEDMDRLLRDLIPGRWSNIRTALGLAGAGELKAHFHPDAAGDGKPARQVADIELSTSRMKLAPIPLELSDVAARLTLEAEGFEVHDGRARVGETGQLALRGRGGWASGRLWTDLQLNGRDLKLGEELIAAMPGPLAEFLGRLSPRGRLQLTLDQVLTNRTQSDEYHVTGRIELDEAELNIGLPLKDYRGQLSGTCEIRPEGGVLIDADFALDQGSLDGRPIERWEGRILRASDSRLIKLDSVRGRFCDGELVGYAEIDLESRRYELSFTLHDVSLDQFIRRSDAERRSSPGGRVDGTVFVRGELEAFGNREGGGEIRIRGTSLLSNPVTASVARAGQDQQRARRREADDRRHEVEEALLRFVWDGDSLKFTRVDIRSRDLRLVGYGSWNTRTDSLALTLVGASAAGAPRVLVLTDLLEAAGQELVQYRVGGTSALPTVTAEPLHNLTEPLRNLLRGGNVR